MNRGGQLERLTRFFVRAKTSAAAHRRGILETPCKYGLFLYFSLSLCYNMCNQTAQEVQEGCRMNEQAKAARRAYKRNWAKQNPEKVKAQQERYWTKKAAEAAEQEPAIKPAPMPAE